MEVTSSQQIVADRLPADTISSTYKPTLYDLFRDKVQAVAQNENISISAISVDTQKKQFHVHTQNQVWVFQYSDIKEELLGALSAQLAPSVFTSKKNGYFEIAKSYRDAHSVSEEELLSSPGLFESRPRITVKNNVISITKGLSRFETFFYGFFFPSKLAEWEKQNKAAVAAYKKFLGPEKLAQAEKIYGFSLDSLAKSGEPLEAKHIYFCNQAVHGPSGIYMQYMQYDALLKEYERLFKEAYGNVYPSKLSTEAKTVLELLNGKKATNNLKERYISFCQAHRTLLKSDKNKEIGQALAWARFMPNIQNYQNRYVKAHIGEKPPLTAQNFHQDLANRNVAVHGSPSEWKIGYSERQMIKYNGDKSLCNYFEVNPPNLRNIEKWQKGEAIRTIYHLRHATPNAYAKQNEDFMDLVEDNLTSNLTSSDDFTIIDPAYKAFLEYTAINQQGVIYACHQKISNTHEGKRCNQIIALERNHPNLLLLFQSVEFPLFKKGADTFAKLKNELIGSFDQGTWNRLPQKLQNNKDYKKEMEEIFNFVHQIFFDSKKDIDQTKYRLYPGLKDHDATETQAFIMLFYHYQREHLKFYKVPNYNFDVTYVNSGCKDDYDRGFNNNCTTDRIHQTGLFGNNVPPKQLEDTAASGMAPTLHGKGIGILPYRLHPALLVSKRLTEMPVDKQKQILRAEDEWKLTQSSMST